MKNESIKYKIGSILKRKSIITFMLLIMCFDIFAKNTEESSGFLTNLRELKEISDIMDLVGSNYVGEKNIGKKKMMQGAIRGLMESLDDPHSAYFTKEELESFREDLKGSYVGVGMVIQKKKNEPLVVVSPIEDSPAFKVGIKPKDQIVAIDGESTYNMTSEESVKKLKGTPKTSVKVVIYRESTKETKEVSIERAEVVLKYVKSRMLDENSKIGYLRLTQFGDKVFPDVKKALEELQNAGMKALVLDLRSNPGGALDQAVKIGSMFIKDGKIVSTKTKNGEEEIRTREGKYYGDFPLAVLINGGSASASEIVAGAIKDHKRGVLVGEKSFGKGSVQTLIDLPDGDAIKLTIAKYFTPSGVCIHGIGIEPDIKVEDKDGYMLFDGVGTVTNIDENQAKENRKELIKEAKGEKAAKEFETHKDKQLEAALKKLREMLSKGTNKKAA